MQVDSENRKYKGMESGYVSYKLSIFWKDQSVCVCERCCYPQNTKMELG